MKIDIPGNLIKNIKIFDHDIYRCEIRGEGGRGS